LGPKRLYRSAYKCKYSANRCSGYICLDDKRVAVLNWLFPGSFNERHNEISGRRKKNTGQWILNAPEVQYWKKPGNHDLLWGYGIRKYYGIGLEL
jgi:hypothetical protein